MPASGPKCPGCQLKPLGTGYVPPAGPQDSRLYFLGEAAGADEVWNKIPFSGAAGGVLARLQTRASIDRSQVRIGNCCWCQPPKNVLEGAKYEQAALVACRERYVQQEIDSWVAQTEEPRVMVTLGGVALRSALNLPRRGIRVQDFHGTVQRDPSDRFWVVPTFHPSHILRGAYNLLGVGTYDLRKALQVLEEGWSYEGASLVQDPSVEWFEEWAQAYFEAVEADPEGVWLAVDIETPDKAKKSDEGELKYTQDKDFTIIRINFSFSTEEGITVPFRKAHLGIIRRLLLSPGPKIFWNDRYDVPRLQYWGYEIEGPIWDFMNAWHVLQSDLPKGLGFVAPLYSNLGPWKHLSGSNPTYYAAMDAVQTLRIAHGVAKDLIDQGMWEVFYRHIYEDDKWVLRPAEKVGVLLDREELDKLGQKLTEQHKQLETEIVKHVPEEVWPIGPKNGLSRPKKGTEGLLQKVLKLPIQCCLACGAREISKTHRCKDEKGKIIKDQQPNLVKEEREVLRFFRRKPFNPGSPKQVLKYILWRGHKPGIAKKTHAPSAGKDVLERLAKSTGDPVYGLLLQDRAVTKVNSTYVKANQERLEKDPLCRQDGRLHPVYTHNPSTLRDSSQGPNWQNIVADRGEIETTASGFRRCVVAAPGCVLIEVDFSAMEAVQTGWFCGDPKLIRLAKLGIHGYVVGELEGHPISLKCSDDDLVAHFKEMKERFPARYDQAKRCVYGIFYDMTIVGLQQTYPQLFPTRKDAELVYNKVYELIPAIPAWKERIWTHLKNKGFIGGPLKNPPDSPADHYHQMMAGLFHPFGYKHYYYNIIRYELLRGRAKPEDQLTTIQGKTYRVKKGEDCKRGVAFQPQSAGAGVLKEARRRLYKPGGENFIGDLFFGQTPLRAPIHDSLLNEAPEEHQERVLQAVVEEMMRPIKQQPCPPEWGLGDYLQIGVEAKIGKNWAPYHAEEPCKPGCKHRPNLLGMKKVKLPQITYNTSIASDSVIPVDEYDEELPQDELPQAEGFSASF